MSSRPPLRLLPRDPAIPPPRVTAIELGRSLAETWERWHPGDPPPDHAPWLEPDDVEQQIREMATLAIERLWDDLNDLGLNTGEIVTFAMFPSPIGGYRLRRLTPVG